LRLRDTASLGPPCSRARESRVCGGYPHSFIRIRLISCRIKHNDWCASWCATRSSRSVALAFSGSTFAWDSPPWTVVSRQVGGRRSTCGPNRSTRRPGSSTRGPNGSTLSTMLGRPNRPVLHRDPSHLRGENSRLLVDGRFLQVENRLPTSRPAILPRNSPIRMWNPSVY